MKKFNQARVNGGSNYDSQPVREAIAGGGVSVDAALRPLVDPVTNLWETGGNTTWYGGTL